MSLIKLDALTNQFPEESGAIQRLSTYLESIKDSRVRELPAKRFFDLMRPSSRRVQGRILIFLVGSGVLEKFFRIESDALGGIGDFRSISDIPTSIFDSRQNKRVEIRLDQVQLMYRVLLKVEK